MTFSRSPPTQSTVLMTIAHYIIGTTKLTTTTEFVSVIRFTYIHISLLPQKLPNYPDENEGMVDFHVAKCQCQIVITSKEDIFADTTRSVKTISGYSSVSLVEAIFSNNLNCNIHVTPT